MPRTTLDLDAGVLERLRRRQREEGRTLGELASELLAHALADDRQARSAVPLRWTVKPMGARVDLDDDDAVGRALGKP